jgi:hypothetical protein
MVGIPRLREAVRCSGAPGGRALPNVDFVPRLGRSRSLIEMVALDVEESVPAGAIIFECDLTSQLH